MRHKTQEDTVLSHLCNIIVNGWLSDRQDPAPELRPYWNLRDELTINNGLSTAPKEPMKFFTLPTLSWQIVSQDLFELNHQSYLLTECHYSDWIKVELLPTHCHRPLLNAPKHTLQGMVYLKYVTLTMVPNSHKW